MSFPIFDASARTSSAARLNGAISRPIVANKLATPIAGLSFVVFPLCPRYFVRFVLGIPDTQSSFNLPMRLPFALGQAERIIPGLIHGQAARAQEKVQAQKEWRPERPCRLRVWIRDA